MVIIKGELEFQLKEEKQMIREGVLKDDSPLDDSEEFQRLLHACRVGDLKGIQEVIIEGVNINARDNFDYTPLILVSLRTVIDLILSHGSQILRPVYVDITKLSSCFLNPEHFVSETLSKENAVYQDNALNNRIRKLLIEYDFSKSTDPLQPLAAHISSLLTRTTPSTSDIVLTAGEERWNLHKFILSARSPYFAKKLAAQPDTTTWKLTSAIPPEAFQIALRYLYLGDVSIESVAPKTNNFVTEDDILIGIDKVSKQLEIQSLWDRILSGDDKRLARQRHQDEVARGRGQVEDWFQNNVLKHKIILDSTKVPEIQWTKENSIFADVLLRADEDRGEDLVPGQEAPKFEDTNSTSNFIPIGPSAASRSPSASRKAKKSVLFPVHRAMLLRSEYFTTMFSSSFREAQTTEFLQVIKVDCSPKVLEIILSFMYTEKAEIPIELALDVLFAADMLFIEKLKNKAAVAISTLGMGDVTNQTAFGQGNDIEVEPINVYDVIRAGWFLKIQRLEVFCARYLAYRLEDYIDEEEFEELIRESANRIEKRQETDTIELLDDIRYYLSEERFRLGFEDAGLEEIMDENEQINAESNEHEISTSQSGEDIENPTTKDDPSTKKPLDGDVEILTLSGEYVEDEFGAATINHKFLMDKIDILLEKLKLNA